MSRNAVLVSGGAGGIGSAICRALAGQGDDVMIADVDSARGQALADEIGGRFIFADFSDLTPDTLDRIAAEVRRVTALVNAAGLADHERFPQVSISEWRRVLRVNLEAPFMLVQALSGHLIEGGAIVNIASAAGSKVVSASGRLSHPYSSSKAGLIMLTKTLARELADRNIRVNSVSPGFTRTPIIDALESSDPGIVEELTPLGRWGEPAEIARLVLYLLSDDATFVTGANFYIDGGLTVA